MGKENGKEEKEKGRERKKYGNEKRRSWKEIKGIDNGDKRKERKGMKREREHEKIDISAHFTGTSLCRTIVSVATTGKKNDRKNIFLEAYVLDVTAGKDTIPQCPQIC